MTQSLTWAAIAMSLLALAAPARAAIDWPALGIDPMQPKLFVDIHHDRPDRSAFTIEASRYAVSVDLGKPTITSLRVFADRRLTRPGYDEVVGGAGPAGDELLGPDGIAIEAEAEGAVYSSRRAAKGARLNVWRHGLYYYEVRVLDCRLADLAGNEYSSRGEWAFHCYPDKLHIEADLRPRAEPPRTAGRLVIDLAAGPRSLDGAPVLRGGESWAAALPVRGEWGSAGAAATLSFDGMGAVALLPAGSESAAGAALAAERAPLGDDRFRAGEGGAFDGYDAVRGCYRIHAVRAAGGYGFDDMWANPNVYLRAPFRIVNDGLPRKIYVWHSSTVGNLEAGVVTDAYGFPLPLPVECCKNFGGEHEEPDDTPFGDTFFPVALRPRQTIDWASLHLFANWGDHPLKQVSSIRFFEHYYHLSTGPTETTCYVPFTKHAYPNAGFTIADFRGMSGHTWTGQPQHHHVALQGFLQYYDGEWHQLMYLNTEFDQIAPNFCRFTMNYRSDDDRVRASVTAFEIPQLDETRSFVRLRYDVVAPVVLADARHDLRLLNANTDITRNHYAAVAWVGVDNEVHTAPVRYDDTWTLEGEPLGSETPFACLYASEKSNNALVVRRFAARLGGREVERPATSLIGYKRGVAEQILTVSDVGLTLEPGDFVEADLILMPYGTELSDWHQPNDERTFFGSDAPRLVVHHGARVDDFPSALRLDAAGFAEFDVAGGNDYLPIIVTGFDDYKAPLLFYGPYLMDAQVVGNDGGQAFAADDGSVGHVFVVRRRSGQRPHRYFVGQATCSGGVVAVERDNNEAIIRCAREGEWRIVSPRLFAGLANRVSPGPAVESKGRAREARSVPLRFAVDEGSLQARVRIVAADEYDIALDGRAAARLLLSGLRAGGRYALTSHSDQIAPEAPVVTADVHGNAQVALKISGAGGLTVRVGK